MQKKKKETPTRSEKVKHVILFDLPHFKNQQQKGCSFRRWQENRGEDGYKLRIGDRK
jgi:hypothetical protein